MKYFVVNGFPRVGKDQFVAYCLEELGPFGILVSTVDFVKKIATKCGWNGVKSLKNRKFLSDLKDLLTEWGDIPFNKTIQEIENHRFHLDQYDVSDSGVVFIMCREPQEIQKFVDKLEAETILVTRHDVELNKQSNHADADVLNFKYNFIIENNGTLEELKEKAKEFLKNI